MASGDANVFPPKNTAFRLYGIHFRDNTGALVTSWTGAASSISIDGAAASSGGTPTEIGTTGMGYLDLTSGDMNGEAISVKCTVTNASANGFVSAIYTLRLCGRLEQEPSRASERLLRTFGAT